jgi:hypothetical protein
VEFFGAVPNLLVSDLTTAIPWYEESLGFVVEKKLSGPPPGVVLRRDGALLLLEETEANVAKIPRSNVDPFGIDALYLVDNVATLYDELRRNDVRMLHGDQDLPEGTRQFGIQTPQNYVIVFSSSL